MLLDSDSTPQFVFNTSVLSNPKEPKGIFQALKGSEGVQWKELAKNKFQNFLNHNSWEIVSREEARKHGKTIIGSKWVFKKKLEPNGTKRFKSRIVSKGYMQVPGVDYTEKFAPIANNMTTRLIIVLTLLYADKRWILKSMDIEAAFLEGYNQGLQFMEWPPGSVELGFTTMDQVRETCLLML